MKEVKKQHYTYIPVSLDACGKEVTLQGTLHFDPNELSISDKAGTNVNPDVKLGPSVPKGTKVIVNTDQLADGDIGFVVDFNGEGASPAVKLASGQKTIVVFKFTLKNPAQGLNLDISWSDSVFHTKAGDDQGQDLPITQLGGSLVTSTPHALMIGHAVERI